MPNSMVFGPVARLGGAIDYPTDRGRISSFGVLFLERQALATDSIGNATITLNNMVVGSRLLIVSQDGTTVHFTGVVAAASETKVIPVYAPGSALNNWRIRVRSGTTAPYYKPYETLLTATKSAFSVYVSQELDQ